jgi:hypothetical protein
VGLRLSPTSDPASLWSYGQGEYLCVARTVKSFGPLLATPGALAENLFHNLSLGAPDADNVILYDDTTGAIS